MKQQELVLSGRKGLKHTDCFLCAIMQYITSFAQATNCCALISVWNAAIVGRLGTMQLGSVGLSNLIFFFCTVLFSFLLAVITPRVAQAKARDHHKEVKWLVSLVNSVTAQCKHIKACQLAVCLKVSCANHKTRREQLCSRSVCPLQASIETAHALWLAVFLGIFIGAVLWFSAPWLMLQGSISPLMHMCYQFSSHNIPACACVGFNNVGSPRPPLAPA